jgi:hypothetical protein
MGGDYQRERGFRKLLLRGLPGAVGGSGELLREERGMSSCLYGQQMRICAGLWRPPRREPTKLPGSVALSETAGLVEHPNDGLASGAPLL